MTQRFSDFFQHYNSSNEISLHLKVIVAAGEELQKAVPRVRRVHSCPFQTGAFPHLLHSATSQMPPGLWCLLQVLCTGLSECVGGRGAAAVVFLHSSPISAALCPFLAPFLNYYRLPML